LLFIAIALPAFAETAQPADLTAEDRIQVGRVEDYMNGLSTAKADFTQIGASGSVSTGTFYLSRPGHLRFDYTAPQKDIIVADGKFIWYYDAQMKDANHAPISRTFADFLLRPTVELFGAGVTITDFAMDADTTTLTLAQTDDPGQGSLTLTLTNHPLQIRQWRVIDAQGRATQIKLDHAQFGLSLDPGLFVFHEPD
jgi:outer membrane lipoprotein-sorting protein